MMIAAIDQHIADAGGTHLADPWSGSRKKNKPASSSPLQPAPHAEASRKVTACNRTEVPPIHRDLSYGAARCRRRRPSETSGSPRHEDQSQYFFYGAGIWRRKRRPDGGVETRAHVRRRRRAPNGRGCGSMSGVKQVSSMESGAPIAGFAHGSNVDRRSAAEGRTLDLAIRSINRARCGKRQMWRGPHLFREY
jgi:hypothetical protein